MIEFVIIFILIGIYQKTSKLNKLFSDGEDI